MSTSAFAADPGEEIYDCDSDRPNVGLEPCYWDVAPYNPGAGITVRVNWDGANYGVRNALDADGREWNSFKRLVRRSMAEWLSSGANLGDITVVQENDDIGDIDWTTDSNGEVDTTSVDFDQIPARSILISADGYPDSKASAYSGDDGNPRCHVVFNTNEDWRIVPSAAMEDDDAFWIYSTLTHELGHCLGFSHFEGNDPALHVMMGGGQSGDPVSVQARMAGPSLVEKARLRRHYGERPHSARVYGAGSDFDWDLRVTELDSVHSFVGFDWAYDENDDALSIAWYDNEDSVIRIAHSDTDTDDLWHYGRYEGVTTIATGLSVAHNGTDTAAVAAGVGNGLPRPMVVMFQDDHASSYARVLAPGANDHILGRPGIEYIDDLDRWVLVGAGVADVQAADDDVWDQMGQIVVWVSDDDGLNWSPREVISTEHRSFGDVSLACTDDGTCRVVFQRLGSPGHEDDVGKLMGLTFEFSGSGALSIGDVDTTSTYSTTGPSIAVDDTGNEPTWMMADPGYKWRSPKFRTASGDGELKNTRTIVSGLDTGRELALEHADGFGSDEWFAAIPFPDTAAPPMFNVLVDPEFENEQLQGWHTWTEDGAAAWFYRWEDRMYIEPTSAGPNPWSIGVAQGDVRVLKGHTYRVEFQARVINGDQPRTIESLVGQAVPPWHIHSYRHVFELGTELRQYAYEFTSPHDDNEHAQLEFDLGTDLNGVVIDNVFMTEVHH